MQTRGGGRGVNGVLTPFVTSQQVNVHSLILLVCVCVCAHLTGSQLGGLVCDCQHWFYSASVAAVSGASGLSASSSSALYFSSFRCHFSTASATSLRTTTTGRVPTS